MRLLFGFLFLYSQLVLAYQSSLTSSEAKLRWTQTSIPLRIVNNSSTLSSATSNAIIQDSIAQWNGQIGSRITQTSTGFNQIRFEQDFSMYGSAVVGVTELNYNSSGVLTGAVIRLNEENHTFTSTPGFSGDVYLGDVVTHELGHFLGLAHSEVLHSSMFYSNFPGQNSISADDASGARSKYVSGYGKITGYVKGGDHVGIMGVHVQAVSVLTGETISTFSLENGYFEIGGLPLNNNYYIYTSPIKQSGALPDYFANTQDTFCPASFVGSFFSACGGENDGIPQPIAISSSVRSVDVGTVSINCSLRTNPDYDHEKIQGTFGRLEIYNYGDEPRYEKSYVGYFRKSQLNTITFSSADRFQVDLRDYVSSDGTPEKLKIQIVSQAFGSPVEYTVAVRRNGITVAGSPMTMTPSSDGILLLDTSLLTPLSSTTSTNIFEVDVRARKLASEDVAQAIPDPITFASTQYWPYLISFSIWDAGTQPMLDTTVDLSDNESCLDAPFAYSVARPGVTAANNTESQKDPVSAAAASCGTIEPPSAGGPGSFMAVATLGFIMSFLSSLLWKRKKKFLS